MSVPGSPDDESTTPTDDTTVIDDAAAHTISLTKTEDSEPTPTKVSLTKPIVVDDAPGEVTVERAGIEAATVDVEQEDPRYAVTGTAPTGPQYAVTAIAPTGPQYMPTQEASTADFGAYQPHGYTPSGPIPLGGRQFDGPPSYPGYPQSGYPQSGYPQSGRPPRNPVKLMLIGVIVLCVVALVIGGVLWWKTSRSDAGQPPLAGQLTKEFPTAPGAAWTYGIGSATSFVSTDSYLSMYMVPGAIHDDTSLVTMAQNNGTGARNVVGVTASGGHWEYTNGMKGCANAVLKHRVACYGDNRIVILDATNGQEVQSFATQVSIGGLAFDGESVYVRSNTPTLTVTKYSQSGDVKWSKSYSESADPASTSGDSATFFATPAFVVAIYTGSMIVASTADGHEFLNRGGSTSTSLLSDGSVVLQASSRASQTDGPVIVVRPDGSVVQLAGHMGISADVSSPHFGDSVFVDGKPMTVSTRSSSWSTTPSAKPSTVPLATDSTVVVGADDKLTAVDPATGASRWSVDANSRTSTAVTDGKNLIFSKADGSVSAVALMSGQQAWSIPSATVGMTGSDYATSTSVYALGDTLVTMTGTQITGFAPTGGTAFAPGATTRNNGSGDSYVTRCGSAPTFTPEQFTSATGGLIIRMKVTATCPDGDVLSGAQTRITVKDGSNLVASGYFNFSGTPLALPRSDSSSGGSRSVDLTFGPGSFYRLPDTLGSTSSNGTSTAGGTTYLVECERGTEAATQAPAPDASIGAAASATGPAPAPGVDTDVSTDDALRRQANADRSFILSNLNNRWVAQLSSKRPGLVAEGKTWTNADILNEFLALRLRFNDVRLLWSDEWPVFSYQGWWVTVAAATFPGPDAANSWCPQQGFDPAHCFAKFISSTAGPDNSTRYWH
ncbi:PQQ-binding-like beta-propeller repeat protein [Gordonia sp. TBRC 11910]|uniref:PQQ-binding-like beta-propeller repeat protein n=1 Tax=Gordonia asplenii TaxID=2725283 RepID=A0A848KXX9_9ACTN|nr:PQQ-binding-like beta-propeller repeat protein [Gordonia asplenii]NMO03604.1 PQQ-binding-like beta-propeller repeat protein [Gordonia asplenii]